MFIFFLEAVTGLAYVCTRASLDKELLKPSINYFNFYIHLISFVTAWKLLILIACEKEKSPKTYILWIVLSLLVMRNQYFCW